MATIKDVAEAAGVSIATVSRVLNQNGYVSPELNQRVQDAIAALGYQRNALARNLRRSESLTLGILVPDSNNSFFSEIAKGVEETCFAKGYTVVLCNTDENPDKATSYLSNLYQHRVAGFIVVSLGDFKPRLQKLIEDGYPIVIVDRPVTDLKADSVISDNFSGARLAMQHLIQLGHRRIAYVVGNMHLETIKARWAGVMSTLEEYGVPLDPSLVYEHGDYTPKSGYAAAEALLKRADPPTAIFAFNDLMAFGVLSYAQMNGIHIPSKVSVVGFDDVTLAAYSAPSLTTVAQPKYALGQKVAEILLDRIHGDTSPPIKLVLPTELIVRCSTASLE
jgi:LacI family transcriptional regulator